ncbi:MULTISPECIES: DUF4842 domain-containing protein [Prevotella]|jgi:hypothetical protein|nr:MULTISPECIES: DUF4842 domain-containing protein [Prevotella]MBR5988337.1 DUF4842 domain-containing protein [Prevotella sp.]
MKKYLMTEMAAVALCFSFTSCSHDFETNGDNTFDPVKNYEEAFTIRFGQPDENQDWGFDSFIAQTRAITRTSNPNANMWGETWEVPETLTTAQKKRVRLYFQYNKTPQNEPIDYKNFFVQDVYKGATTPLNNGSAALITYSTEKYTFNNQQEPGSEHMDKLTAGSNQDHIYNYNDANCSSNSEVWDGVSYEAGWPRADASEAENLNHKKFHTDYIMLMENSKTDCFGWHETQGEIQHDDHYVIISAATIDAWADAHSELGDLGAPVTDKWNRNFVGFDYEAQVDLNQLYARDWRGNILYYDQAHTIPYLKVETNQYAHTIVPAGTPGALPIKDRYVDNDQTKGNLWAEVGCADGYYSDWIVCITDAKKKGTTPPPGANVRIIAEDLTVDERGDFDFNDVVFDVYYNTPSSGKTTIKLLAAGGTLPLTVAGFEVHEKFAEANPGRSITTSTMINTHANGGIDGLDPVTIVVDNSYNGNAINIPIIVTKQSGTLTLQANRGRAPHKIAVKPTFEWCDERQDIERAYPDFADWVRNPSVSWY